MAAKVIIIGGGLSGLTAALAVARKGGQALVMDKGVMGAGTNSAMANAYFTGPTAGYSRADYVADTLEIGKHLNRKPWVEAVADNAEAAVDFARGCGFALDAGPNNYTFPAQRPDRIRGLSMMTSLAELARREPGVKYATGCQVLELAKERGRVSGARLLDKQGAIRFEPAGAVILAAGGAGALWRQNDNMKSQLGQGYLLAARAGLALMDMEFVQFYPLVLAEPGLPQVMLYPPYPPGARLLAHDGRDILLEQGVDDLNLGILMMRDRLSGLLYRESLRGPVRLDYTAVADGFWREYPLAMLKRIKFDFRRQAVTVCPGAHFNMGGVAADLQGNTEIPGLLACGEMLWGLHGANRRGGNALMECLVSGFLAGRAAADQAARVEEAQARTEDRLTDDLPASQARKLLPLLRELAWRRAGVVRDAAGLAKGREELAGLSREIRDLPRDSAARLKARENLSAGALVLSAVLEAATARQETRGAQVRDDFTERDDRDWRVNSCWRAEGGLSHQPADCPAPAGDAG